MPATRDPFANPPKGLRTRVRAGGRLAVWWEPNAVQRAAGMAPVPLDETRPTWSLRQATELNRTAARRMKGAAALDGRRTIDALAHRYLTSTQYCDLAPATQGDYRRLTARVVDRLGHKLANQVDKPMLYDWYEELRATKGVRMTQSLIRMASILLSHAERIGWRDGGTNPALNMQIKQPDPRRRVGTWAELDALLAASDALGLPGIALAVCLSALNGQRKGDALSVTAGQFTTLDGPTGPVIVLGLVRSKRQTAGVLPIHPEAAPRLALALAAAHAPDAIAVTRADGRAYSQTMFRDDWNAVRALAAQVAPTVTDLQFRDLRRTFGALSRASGTTKDDVAAVLGNSADTNFALGMTYMPPELAETMRAVAGVKRGKA